MILRLQDQLIEMQGSEAIGKEDLVWEGTNLHVI